MKKRQKSRRNEELVGQYEEKEEIIDNSLFDDPDTDMDVLDDELNDLMMKLDNITDAYKDEDDNPFYYFLNKYSY